MVKNVNPSAADKIKKNIKKGLFVADYIGKQKYISISLISRAKSLLPIMLYYIPRLDKYTMTTNSYFYVMLNIIEQTKKGPNNNKKLVRRN